MLQSIYTHAGCDYGCLYTYSPRHCFNPHTHAGCDNVHNVSGASFPVSIHTPTQGVTFLYICNVFRICFNPHTHAGCDNPLPRLTRVHNRFNPHTHAGCDYCKDNKCKIISVSIHTPTQGVTTLAAVNSRNPRVSIHTPTQGVTIVYIGKLYHVPVSIHTPTQGVTQAEVWKVWHRSFNPHTHAGCDSRSIIKITESKVSIHTPTQGVTMEN